MTSTTDSMRLKKLLKDSKNVKERADHIRKSVGSMRLKMIKSEIFMKALSESQIIEEETRKLKEHYDFLNRDRGASYAVIKEYRKLWKDKREEYMKKLEEVIALGEQ